MGAEQIFQWLVGILGSLGLVTLKWIHSEMKALQTKQEENKADLSKFRETVAGEYARRAELEVLITRFESKIDTGFQRLSDKLDKKVDK